MVFCVPTRLIDFDAFSERAAFPVPPAFAKNRGDGRVEINRDPSQIGRETIIVIDVATASTARGGRGRNSHIQTARARPKPLFQLLSLAPRQAVAGVQCHPQLQGHGRLHPPSHGCKVTNIVHPKSVAKSE